MSDKRLRNSSFKRGNFLKFLGVIAVATIVVSGCAAQGDGQPSGSATPPDPGATENISLIPLDAKLAAEVPEAYTGRTLNWGSATQVPYTNLEADGTVSGLIVDLAAQLSSILGVEIKVAVTPLDAIITGVQSGRIDIGGANGDYVERQALADFSDFAQSHANLLVQAKGSYNPKTLMDICGKKIGIEKGAATLNSINAVNDKCTKNGKQAAQVLTYPDGAAAVLAVVSGRIDARLDPIAPNSLAAATSDGQLEMISIEELVSLPGASSTYGIVTKKGSGMADALTAAVRLMYDEGVYTKLFEKWQIPGSAIPLDRIATNGATLHQKG